MVTTGIDLGPLIVDEDSVTYLDYCTLADVEAYSGVNFSDGIGPSDAQIGVMITNASRLVDAYAGQPLAGTVTVTEYQDAAYFEQHCVLAYRPVQSITTLNQIKDDGSETLLVQGKVRNTDDYWLHDQDAGIVRFMDQLQENVKVRLKFVYVGGNTAVPIEAKMATILMVVKQAGRAAMNDENCTDRLMKFWMNLIKNAQDELDEMLRMVKRNQIVGVATFGLQGNY
jgi:hypothetical protein|tara:strand:+ start:561 stop:1241 length:681 start_codon:yes stop_codon:yes gene_type:complete